MERLTFISMPVVKQSRLKLTFCDQAAAGKGWDTPVGAFRIDFSGAKIKVAIEERRKQSQIFSKDFI